MSTIHQMYCTHCTHGTSALEHREGDLAQRTLGYSVRAGSLEGEALRRFYQQIEPLVYYYLPRDTSDGQKLQFDGSTAPKRFFYVPSAEGLQVLGQVCYRPTDSEGRPGCYFAHLVFQEEKEAVSRWSAPDAVRMWGATGWAIQDSPEIPFTLEPLSALADLLQGGPPVLDDGVLASFLREPGDSEAFVDPTAVVPDRWRAMDPAVRRDWFLRIFSTIVQTVTADRRPLVLVAEPGVAALMFYGTARLLPSGALRDETSFSTFESDPDRSGAFVSATWFSDASAAAAKPDACPWQKTTLNTLLALETQKIPAPSKYAQAMVERLLTKGGEELDADLQTMATVRIGGAQDLDALVRIDEAVDALLRQGAFPAADWRNWPAGIDYLRQKLGQRLTAVEDVEAGLKAVAGGTAHLTVVDLLTTKPAVPGTRQAVVHLLRELPAEKIRGLLKLGGVPDEDKVIVLVRHIHAQGDLPPGCEFLWDEWAAATEQPRRAGVVLMARVLAKLPPKSVHRLYANAPAHCAHGFLTNCLRLVRHKKMKLASLTEMIRAADEEVVFKLVRTGGAQFLATYPKNEPALGEKLVALLKTLPKHADDFKERLDLILAGEHLLGDETYRQAAASWDKCYKEMRDVGRLQQPDPTVAPDKRQPLLVAACREMAMAADRAMTLDTMDGDYPWSQKRDFLLRIGQRVLGGTPLFLPGSWESEELLRRVDIQFQQHRFPTDPLKKDADKKKEPAKKVVVPEEKTLSDSSRSTMIATVGLLLLISAAVLFAVYWLLFRPSGSGARPKRDPRGRLKKKTPAAWDWKRPGPGGPADGPRALALDAESAPAPARGLIADVLADIPFLVHEAVVRSG